MLGLAQKRMKSLHLGIKAFRSDRGVKDEAVKKHE